MESTTRFDDLELRIRANLAVNKNRAQPQNSRSGRGGGNSFVGSSWRQPYLTIELITTKNNGEKTSSSSTITKKKSDTDDDITSKKMTSYFNELIDGYAVIPIEDTMNWIRHEKDGKKIDVQLRIQCYYCFFEEEMTLEHLPFIYVNIVKKKIPKVIPNCDPMKHGCCLEELWLDFSDDDWIGYPKRYNIGRCTGQCGNIGFTRDTIASKSMKKVEHRFLLTILSEQKKSNKKLCCSPKKFGPMALLYRNKKNFEMTILQDAVITECQCA